MTACTALTPRLSTLRQDGGMHLAVMATHIRACARCRGGKIVLPRTFVLPDLLALDHGAHQPTFASYYEATHPEYVLASMRDEEIVAIALHLALCVPCSEQFEALCVLSELEEQGDEPEPEE